MKFWTYLRWIGATTFIALLVVVMCLTEPASWQGSSAGPLPNAMPSIPVR
jgi:hypothetical protein